MLLKVDMALAEDANSLSDFVRGRKVENVGISNVKDGPDRIVNGKLIQTKYYETASDTIEAAFDEKTGLFRYKNQQLEVPKDQYEDAIAEMAEKIREGKVQGVTDPEEASSIIKEGNVTYKQAKNIAKAGNIDSLVFDVKTQSVVAVHALGISFAIQYAVSRWNGLDRKDALKLAITSALKTGSLVLLTGVLTQQLLRTQIGRSFSAFATKVTKQVIDQLYKSEIGKKAVNKIASGMLGKSLTGAAAKNALTKLLRTNIVTGVVAVGVMSAPDFYKALISKKISWKQFAKNIVVTSAGVAGGAGGAILGKAGGAAIGGAIGSVIPVIGTAVGAAIGGFIGLITGGIAGGTAAAVGTKKIADLIAEDDAQEMMELIQEAVARLAEDYLITEDEFNESSVSEKINATISPKWLQNMYQAGANHYYRSDGQISFAYQEFEPLFEELIAKRKQVKVPSLRKIRWEMSKTKIYLFFEYIKIKIAQLFGKKSELADLC